jgi:hypothetical protein
MSSPPLDVKDTSHSTPSMAELWFGIFRVDRQRVGNSTPDGSWIMELEGVEQNMR